MSMANGGTVKVLKLTEAYLERKAVLELRLSVVRNSSSLEKVERAETIERDIADSWAKYSLGLAGIIDQCWRPWSEK